MNNEIKPLEGNELVKYLRERLDYKHKLWVKSHYFETMYKDKLERISKLINDDLNFFPCINCDKPCNRCDIKKVIEILRENILDIDKL